MDWCLNRAARKKPFLTSNTGLAVYIIDDAAKTISVTRIAHRREVYE